MLVGALGVSVATVSVFVVLGMASISMSMCGSGFFLDDTIPFFGNSLPVLRPCQAEMLKVRYFYHCPLDTAKFIGL